MGNTPTWGFVFGGVWTFLAVLRWGNVAVGDSGFLGMTAQVIVAVLSTLLGGFSLVSAVRLRRLRRAERDPATPGN